MIFRHRKFKFFTVTLLVSLFCLPHTILSLAPAPVDYLVPPPLPPSSAAARFKPAPARPQNLLSAESKTIPKFVNTQQLPAKPNEQSKHPGLMTRVARWFGFANQNSAAAPGAGVGPAASPDQQLTAGSSKQAYYYQKPQQQYATGDKENCGLCNKYPWVPMMANSIHYPAVGNQWDAAKQSQYHNNVQQYQVNNNVAQNTYNAVGGQQQQQQQNSYGVNSGVQYPPQIQHSASNVKQRAVKFNFPLPYVPPNKTPDTPNHIQYSTGPFLPIPVPPLLSNNALPPIYNAQNFHPSITPAPNTIQQLPSTEPAHFAENIAEHSEIHIDTVIPTQIPPTIPNKDASFEIVKSHQLVDYISSVEYPASYVPSHSYDVSTQAPLTSLSNQHTASKISTGLYQHPTLSPNLNQHVPASQILTDPNSFITGNQQQSEQQTEQTYFSQHVPASQILTDPNNFVTVNQQQSTQQTEQTNEHTTIYNHQPQYLEQVQHYEYDNYVAASHQNSSVFVQQHKPPQSHLDAWSLESNDYVYATSTPEAFSTTNEETSTFTTELDTTTILPQTQDNEVEFVASVQTNAQQTTKLWPQKPKQRETPKRLLDSPIQHINGNFGAPRPFTRDPSDLTFRLGAKNHKFSETNQAAFTQESWKPQTPVTEAPISTSTFSSIDASGQYAGMAPPSLPSTYNSDQVVLPYLTSKNRPRPFETTRVDMVTRAPSTAVYSTWSHAQNVELHTPQESMLVKSHIRPSTAAITTTTTTTPKPRTTKYLTKILASNLRELLQREHEPTKLKLSPNSLDIDINKLQKNIDDWTEQEYTSLSHRPSTPTIRGRSKHIPSEYLPTTTAAVKAARQSKTTKGFTDNSELHSSINNLEPLYERESTKRYQYTQITDNHLRDLYNNFEAMKSKIVSNYKSTTPAPTITSTTVATTSRTTSTTSTTTTTEKPYYLRSIPVQEPEELWKKAKVSISPKTQEKVYVVTPQPRFFPQRFYAPTAAPPITTTTTTTSSSITNRPLSSLGSGFKSPRFLVRPTPGNAHKLSKISDTQSKENSKENLSNSYFTPEWFGLRGLSAYVPSEPVEIIDGNSKVLNIVTPPSNLETTTRHNIMDLTKDRHTASKKKSTMAPSPR